MDSAEIALDTANRIVTENAVRMSHEEVFRNQQEEKGYEQK